jgi:flagellar M-ring protein FliF
MDFVNKSYNQLGDLFRSLTPGARIIAGLLLAVIVTSLLFLFRYRTDHADEYLFGGEPVTQGELVAIEAAFGKAKLNSYEIVGNRVRVPKLQRHTYLAALADGSALPQNFGGPTRNMFESDSPFDTRDIRERKARFAKESELSKIILEMAEIQEATVKIEDMPATTFGAARERRALAAVRALGTQTLDTHRIRNIRQTVAAGAGVKPEFVTVTDLNGQVSPGLGGEHGANEFDNLYAANQQMFIEKYTKLIAQRLSAYPGIQIAVHVELDKDMHNQTSSFKYDDKPTTIASQNVTRESSTKSAEPSGRPGAVPNGAISNASAQVVASAGNETTENETREDLQSAVGGQQTTTQKVPLSPTFVTASIGVPTSYFSKIWHLRNPTAAGEDPKVPPPDQLKQIETEKLREIEEAVVLLLPRVPKGDDQYKPVKVVTYDETPFASPEPPTMAETSTAWFAENWSTVGMFLLAIGGIVFLRSMVQSAQSNAVKSAEAAREAAMEALAKEQERATAAVAEDAVNALKRKRFQGSGRGLREELTELVREDPDAAANVLRLWISEAA